MKRFATRTIVSFFVAKSQVWTLAIGLVLAAIFCGCNRAANRDPVHLATVTGPSMSPTFWGPRVQIQCNRCGIEWTANASPTTLPERAIVCWNCGQSATVDTDIQTGDQITINLEAYKNRSPAINDIVAIKDEHEVRIKRVVAVEGDTLTADDRQCFRNGHPIAPANAMLQVHDDRFRYQNISWWKSENDQAIPITSTGFRLRATTEPGTLRYRHRDVYNQTGQSAPFTWITDDAPSNLFENRQQQPIERIQLTARLVVNEGPATILFWFQTMDGVKRHSLVGIEGIHALAMTWDDAAWQSTEQVKVPLQTLDAVVIELLKGDLEIHDLVLQRPLVYRPRGSQSLPLTVPRGHCFVIGDNESISIDSRHTGPINVDNIIGKVEER